MPETRSRRATGDLDDKDARIIELLTSNGRLSNRAIAGEIDLTEATVAARIRNLVDRRILGVSAVIDWRAAGYGFDAWVEVEVRGRSVREVAFALADLPGVHSVHVVFGPVDLIVHVILTNQDEATEFLGERIGKVRGVWRSRPNVTLETVKYNVHFARLPVRASEVEFPDPVVELDDLDHLIIESLVLDGRRSNRELARTISVSEGTVRMRLKRLETAGLLRIVGQSDPSLTGLVGAWAIIGVDVKSGTARRVARIIAALPDVQIVAVSAGRHDVLVFLATRSRTRLVDIVVNEIRTIAGVQATETWEIVQTARLNWQLGRLFE